MVRPELIIIAAVARNNVIGNNQELPWKPGEIKGDLPRFQKLTQGYPVIMGRNTYESLPDKFRPLPGRLNVILTSNLQNYSAKNLIVASSLDQALAMVESGSFPEFKTDKAYVIGGNRPFTDAMSIADRLEITHVHRDYFGNVKFPVIDENIWQETARENHGGSSGHSFVSYIRKQEIK
jgi:dihydrofolate reductase